MTKPELIKGGKAYLKENNMKVPKKEFKKAINEIWKTVNANNDKVITLKELGQAVFGLIDQNHDGSVSLNELEDAVKVLANAFGIELADDAMDKVKGIYDAVNTDNGKGVEWKEIIDFIEKNDVQVHNLKDAIKSLAKK